MQSPFANLQNCLFEVHTWFSYNGYVINPEKSEAVILSTIHCKPVQNRCRAERYEIVAGCVVTLTDTVKILGVTVDRHLTFDSHVQNVHTTYVHTERTYYHSLKGL